MAGEIIAGHQFDLRGRCKLLRTDGTVCPTRWLDIHDADEGCIGVVGYSHDGKELARFELKQIQDERDAQMRIFDQAINQRAVPAEEEPEVGYLTMCEEAAEVPEGVWEALADALSIGQGWVRVTADGIEHVPLSDVLSEPEIPTWGTQDLAVIDPNDTVEF